MAESHARAINCHVHTLFALEGLEAGELEAALDEMWGGAGPVSKGPAACGELAQFRSCHLLIAWRAWYTVYDTNTLFPVSALCFQRFNFRVAAAER